MDIITTGQTKTSAERLNAITTYIRGLHVSIIFSNHLSFNLLQNEFRQKIDIMGLKYGNLYDFVTTKAATGDLNGINKDQPVTEKEFREALNVLEDDNVIALTGHSSSPTIRFI